MNVRVKHLRWVRRMIRELRIEIATAEWWNGKHPNETPFDVEPERLMLDAAVKYRDAMMTAPNATCKRRLEELVSLAETVLAEEVE